jgi:hypothetical protein
MPSPPTNSAPTPSHYELLQVPTTASADQLRRSFRLLSKRYHPDTTTLPAGEAQEAFRRLRHAYAVLSDPGSRRAYDDELRRAVAAVPAAARPATRVVRPVPVRRALSGGEWFALLLLAVALVLSLIMGIGVAWARGMELMHRPSWWSPAPERSIAAGAGAVAAGEPPSTVPTTASPAVESLADDLPAA